MEKITLMQLIINNLGPIKKGEIDLSKDFYVFVGYNNSGKTYVSHLFWTIFNENTIGKFSKSVEEIINFEGCNGTFEISQSLLDNVLTQWASFLAKEVIPETFNVPKTHSLLKGFSLEFKCGIEEIKPHKKQGVFPIYLQEKGGVITLSKQKGSLTVKLTENSLDFWDNLANPSPIEEAKSISAALLEFILNMILNKTQNTFFLPSSRLIYLAFYQDFYRLEKEKKQEMSRRFIELIEMKEKGEPYELDSLSINAFKGFYTAPMESLFEKLYRLNEPTTVSPHYDNLTAELANLIGGDIVTKSSLGIAPIAFYLSMSSKPSEELEMYLSSSSVNQLSTLYLYFKYWAKKEHNFLLIDEPEENLHPRHQMALLNVLFEFANNNNRVLITTHSPLLADMVNNYHYMAFLKSKQVQINPLVKNYPEMNLDIQLTIEKMGIYFFDGSQIQSYKMGNYGVFFEDFYYEIKKTKDISDLLTDQIYELINHQEDS
jgi:AAA15 family ATPase/GTPase